MLIACFDSSSYQFALICDSWKVISQLHFFYVLYAIRLIIIRLRTKELLHLDFLNTHIQQLTLPKQMPK